MRNVVILALSVWIGGVIGCLTIAVDRLGCPSDDRSGRHQAEAKIAQGNAIPSARTAEQVATNEDPYKADETARYFCKDCMELWTTLVQAVSAAAVAVFTGLLVRYGRKGWVAAKDSADAATNAANLNRKALLMAHRPRLLLKPITVDGFSDGGHIADNLTNGLIYITNVGALDATMQFFHAQWLEGTKLPTNNPVLTTEGLAYDAKLPAGSVVPHPLPDHKVEFPLHKSVENALDTLRRDPNADLSGLRHLYLVGYLKYRDEIGLRRTYFAFQYDPKIRTFAQVDHPAYNYEA